MEGLKKFSAAEVSLHSSKKDCWISIHGKVYDVTPFLDEHPGGDDVLIHVSGMGDATQSFEDVGHSSKARSLMTKYMIGVLDDSGKAPGEQKGVSKAKKLQEKPTTGLWDAVGPLVVLAASVGAWYYLKFVNEA